MKMRQNLQFISQGKIVRFGPSRHVQRSRLLRVATTEKEVSSNAASWRILTMIPVKVEVRDSDGDSNL